MDSAELDRLRSSVRGSVLTSGDDGYEAARRVYNGAIDRRPAVIVRCAGVADVVRAIAFAHEESLLASIRGGGHNVAGKAVVDGGVMIDLAPMKSVRVDPGSRRVRAEGGVTLRDLDHETQAFGMATPMGTVSATGIAGLTLGGGLGHLMRKYGLACDNLVSADVITAGGRLVRASAEENTDLFWGLRGGGGNFGVVTAFEYRLFEIGTMVGGLILHPIDRARALLRFHRETMASAPDELSALAAMLYSPDGQPVCAQFPACVGPVAQGEKLVAPLKGFGPPLADMAGPIAYCDLQKTLDAGFPNGLSNYWTANFVRELSDDVIDILADGFARAPNALSAVVIEEFGGAVKRIDPEDTAVPLRDGQYNVVLITRWTDPAHAERCLAWARGLYRALTPHFISAAYVNYLPEELDGTLPAVYGARRYQRLSDLKRKYDPDNFFRMNQNIKPAA
jgi:FAD/FMN-containing dehydrogenase